MRKLIVPMLLLTVAACGDKAADSHTGELEAPAAALMSDTERDAAAALEAAAAAEPVAVEAGSATASSPSSSAAPGSAPPAAH